MKTDLDFIETLVTNVNNIITHYAHKEKVNTLYAIMTFWACCSMHETAEDIVLKHKNEINNLISKTQDFMQYSNNYMPIGIKVALLNIKTAITENKFEHLIPVQHIKLRVKHEDL